MYQTCLWEGGTYCSVRSTHSSSLWPNSKHTTNVFNQEFFFITTFHLIHHTTVLRETPEILQRSVSHFQLNLCENVRWQFRIKSYNANRTKIYEYLKTKTDIRVHPKHNLKGVVHPKMKMMSLYTHPQVVYACMTFFVLLISKEDILKNVQNYTHHWLP